jgi:hypothetical protein
MAKSKAKEPPPVRIKPSKELRDFAKRVESESHAYDHRTRNNLKQNQGR